MLITVSMLCAVFAFSIQPIDDAETASLKVLMVKCSYLEYLRRCGDHIRACEVLCSVVLLRSHFI